MSGWVRILGMNWPRFQLWRLFAATACFAATAGLIRFAVGEIRGWGWGGFPALCLFASLLAAVAGTGMLFRRAREFLVWTAVVVLRLLMLLTGG